jgi:hypothetical protein
MQAREVVRAEDYDEMVRVLDERMAICVKERDDLRLYASQCSLNADNANTSLNCACEELKAMRAERDALKATVERVRVLPRDWKAYAGRGKSVLRETAIEAYRLAANRLDRALAPQGEEVPDYWKPCCLPYPHHVHCCRPERRGTTGHDAKGRRHEDQPNVPKQGYGLWDRRQRTRRGGRGV